MTGFRRQFATFLMGGALSVTVAAPIVRPVMAQSPVALYGYSRATLPGIPGGPAAGEQTPAQGPAVFPLKYYFYVEVERGSQVSAGWARIRGNYYDCTLTKVSTPVTVDTDPGIPTGKKETLVPETSKDVYNVVLGGAHTAPAGDLEKAPTAKDEAVVALTVNGSLTLLTLQSIKELPPAAAM